MTFNASAELVLVADEPIVQNHLDLAIQLCDVPDRSAIVIDGRRCIWPLQIELQSHNKIADVGGHLHYLATHLRKKRETIAAVHSLGCNIQLTLYLSDPLTNFFISSSTLKTLGELELQVDFRTVKKVFTTES